MNNERESEATRPRRRAARLLLLPLKLIFRAALRAMLSAVIFLTCAAVTVRLLGYELPAARELEKYFDGVERLADVLS